MGYFANVAQLQPSGHYKTLRGHVDVIPHHTSVIGRFNAPPEWIIYQEVLKGDIVTVKEISPIHPRWLVQLASHYYDLHENEAAISTGL